MYAIVEIAGLQYKVKKDQQLYVNRLQGSEGDTISFDRVLLTDNGSISVGAPVIEGALVEAKILEHLKGDKVIVFKKKRRKGYRKKNGFRPHLTKLEITGISVDGKSSDQSSKKKTAPAKKEEAQKVAEKPAKKEEKVEEPVAKPKAKKAKASEKDDLTIIEGIGAKTAEYFNENGIHTYGDLAAKSSDELSALLKEKGGIYASMTTDTWPEQAKMASEGKFDELKAWQEELDGGKK